MNRTTLLIGAAVGLVCSAFLFALPWMRRAAEENLTVILVDEPLAEVRAGKSRVRVSRTDLLRALADDPVCVANLTAIDFSSVELDADDANSLEKLSNVNSIFFYCCHNADAVVPACVSLPLEDVGFELTQIKPESIAAIGDIHTFKSIAFVKNLSEEEVAAIRSLPSHIDVETNFPLDAFE